MKKLYKFVLFVFVAFLFVTPVFAQSCDPLTDAGCVPAETFPPDSTNPSLPDVAVLIAIVAFITERVELSKNAKTFLVIGVGAFLWFTPLLAVWFPQFSLIIDQVLAFIKWVLVAMGSVDFITNASRKAVKSVTEKG